MDNDEQYLHYFSDQQHHFETLKNQKLQMQTYFKNYKPHSDIDMNSLLNSNLVELKIYKSGTYFGETCNEVRHGIGVMLYHKGRVYEGSWKNDFRNGKGYELFSNGCIYEGEYLNGKPNGVGRFSWPNGQFFEGEWLNGMRHGIGTWSGAKGDAYNGEWQLGKADGYGLHRWINGGQYQGQFQDGFKNGKGKQKFANGDCYIGNYYRGKPSGEGEYRWANGSYFQGTFLNGLRHGHGIWRKGNSADKYEGEYINDQKHGFGIFTWQNGNTYRGQYRGNVRNGYGQMHWIDGSYYKGQWKDGVQQGRGKSFQPKEGYKEGIYYNSKLVQSNQNSVPNTKQPALRQVTQIDSKLKQFPMLRIQDHYSGMKQSHRKYQNNKGVDKPFDSQERPLTFKYFQLKNAQIQKQGFQPGNKRQGRNQNIKTAKVSVSRTSVRETKKNNQKNIAEDKGDNSLAAVTAVHSRRASCTFEPSSKKIKGEPYFQNKHIKKEKKKMEINIPGIRWKIKKNSIENADSSETKRLCLCPDSSAGVDAII